MLQFVLQNILQYEKNQNPVTSHHVSIQKKRTVQNEDIKCKL